MAKGRVIKRMLGGAFSAAASVCPPGFFCMDNGFVAFVIVVLGALLIGVYLHNRPPTSVPSVPSVPTVPSAQKIVHFAEPLEEVRVFKGDGAPVAATATHGEYDRRQPTAPERDYGTPSDLRGFIPPPGVPVIPIQIPTQGLPEQFQQVGVLAAPGGTATSATPNRTLLPLFGRKVAIGRDRFNYYTRSDGINPLQVPVSFKNRNCEDDNGCDEISNGDTVGVPLLGQTYVATTYRYTLPRYIPYVN
jgi:hypothetical protein